MTRLTWINFSIVRNAESVDNVLEALGELVQPEVGRRSLVRFHLIQDWADHGASMGLFQKFIKTILICLLKQNI